MEHGAFFFEKNATKHVQNKFGQFWEQFWAFLQFWIFFDFFANFRWLHGTLSKKTFSKISPQNTVGHLGTIWTILGLWTFFWFFFLNLFYVSSANFKSGKPNSNFLSPENWPHIFKSRKSEKPCMEHLAKKLGKIASKHVQNTFGHFWRRIWSIWNFENFLIFFEIFLNPTLHGTRGIFFEKNATKHVQNKFGQFWEQFWAFLQFWIFFDFLAKTFDDSMEHWAKNFFEKIAPKHVSTLGNDFGQF